MARLNLMLLACLVNTLSLSAQDSTNLAGKVLSLPTRFIDKIQNKCVDLDTKLIRRTEKYLNKLEKQESRIKRKLAKINPSKAQHLFANTEGQYIKLSNKLKNQISLPKDVSGGEYQPYTDSIKTSLTFLLQNNKLLSTSKEMQSKIQSSLSHVNQLQSKLKYSEDIRAFVQHRKQQLKEAINGYSQLPKSITKSLNNYKRESYYYARQVKEYRDAFEEPEKMVKKGLSMLNKLPAFKQFMKEHGELAGLFNLPAGYENASNVAGLQTRNQVMQLIQTRLNSAGTNGMQVLQQKMQIAQSGLNDTKEKIKHYGQGSADMDMPDFKPNTQRTKPFFKRLEYGTNIQTTKNTFLPTTSDLGLSVGYKLNDKSTVGIGASYKMGWGKDIKHIAITHQGMGLRSYLDIKLKGSFFASGGVEYNYQPLNEDSLSNSSGLNLSEISSWQKSGLFGISKIISIKSKFFKKTKLQLLWDFLSYQEVPRSQPIKFRVGYNL
jgi:hypothetical protein